MKRIIVDPVICNGQPREDVLECLRFSAELMKHQFNLADWSELSLWAALRGLENEPTPEYSEGDFNEKWK